MNTRPLHQTTRRLLTIPEVAEVLGVARSTLYLEVMSGRLPSLKIGRARRVPPEALEEFIQRRLEETADA